MPEPRELTIHSAVEQMQQGKLTASRLVASCLARIESRDPTVQAWVEVYAEEALETADRYDRDFQAGKWHGALHGIPMGVKDIIDVKSMWTRAGCDAYPARLAALDAPVVRKLREAGAIILGKTETTAFANNDPSVTRNPWNTGHTPGGSSSGSGAAVADRMCLAALGTQTGGSVLRPAAYNGIVGLKPTYAMISTQDVIPVSWTLDHVGIHARSVSDAKRLFAVAKDGLPDRFAHMPAVAAEEDGGGSERSYKLGYPKSFIEAVAEAEVVSHLSSIRSDLTKAGATIVDIDLKRHFDHAADAHRVIMDTELAAFHNNAFPARIEQYPPQVKERIAKGLASEGIRYVEAVRRRIAFQAEIYQVMHELDAVLMPTAPSAAPKGLASTGSPVFCVPWSFAGYPSITLPSGLNDQGLPLAMQLGMLPGQEEKLFSMAAWCENILQYDAMPE